MIAVPEVQDGSELAVYTDFAVEYRDASHRYWLHLDGQRTPAVSVTGALRVLDKPALIGWAERCGAEGALRLERAGELHAAPVEEAINLVRLHKMGADAKRDAGADRGTAIHEALRLYCSEGKVPNVGEFPAEVRGYVQGLCRWLVAEEPEPIQVEKIVGSVQHGYAGRFDLLANMDGRRMLVDLKTSPKVYPEHHLQTAAYMHALVECEGEDAQPDCGMVLAVAEDGSFATSACCAEPRHFLAVLAAQRALSAVSASVRAIDRAAEAATA